MKVTSLEPLGTRHLIAFFALTFAITWGTAAFYFAFPRLVDAWFGGIQGVTHPLFLLAVYGPAIAAIAVIAATRGSAGLRAFSRRLLHLRVHPLWYVAVLLGLPASMLLARWIQLARGVALPAWPPADTGAWLAAAALSLVADPGGVEELGWRGFALPLLQRRRSALVASLILGLVWGVWHLPAFFVEGAPQGGYPFAGFVAGSMIVSLLMTVIYNHTGGSILVAFLFHWANNDPLAIGKQALAGPWIVLCGVVAVAAVAGLGPRSLGRTKVTDPLPARGEA